MKHTAKSALALLIILSAVILTGCSSSTTGSTAAPLNGTAANDILTFDGNESNKPIVRVGMQYHTPDFALIKALQERFPDYLFVLDYSPAAGTDSGQRLRRIVESESQLDMIITSATQYVGASTDCFVDLSAERFLDNYLLSALNGVSVDEHIYTIPGVSTLTGIAYNADLFAEHGWQVPTNIEEYFALCETITAAGIMPMSNCFKYASQVNTTFGMMCYDQLFMSIRDSAWVWEVQRGEATFAGHMEPFYELAERYARAGLAAVSDFSASLTKQRQAFWAGEYAMIFYNSSIFNYAVAEEAPFKVGIMPFPARDSKNSGFSAMPEYYILIPKTVERDPERLALMKEVLAFISTPEGQKAMLSGSLSVSNVKGVTMLDHPAFDSMREAYERGNLYPVIEYPLTDVPILELQAASIRAIFEGATAEEAIAMMDASLTRAWTEGVDEPVYEVIATAERDFTLLETSYYLADTLKEAAGADIGLMVNGGYFRSNLYALPAGDITSDLNVYVMKGIGGADFLTTYELTGAQIKALIERPLINGAETDVLIAASGLAIEYAPWNARGSRVLKLTLEGGRELADDQVYTVAAWAGVIDERYITRTVQAHDALGTLPDILKAAFKRDGKIAPNIADRVKLVWPENKAAK